MKKKKIKEKNIKKKVDINLKKDLQNSNELDQLKKEKKRLLAEIANKHERYNEEKKQISKYCVQKVIIDLIDILNNFELSLGFEVNEKETKNFLVGIKMVQQKLEKVLNNYGLTKIEVNVNDVFDEKYHEIIEIKYNKNFKENTILKIKQSGYKLHDRVLQPTKIILNKFKEKGENKNE